MKTIEAIEKLKSDDLNEREDGVWVLYVNALHSYKTLEHHAKKEQDWKLKNLLESMLKDFRILHDKENS